MAILTGRDTYISLYCNSMTLSGEMTIGIKTRTAVLKKMDNFAYFSNLKEVQMTG